MQQKRPGPGQWLRTYWLELLLVLVLLGALGWVFSTARALLPERAAEPTPEVAVVDETAEATQAPEPTQETAPQVFDGGRAQGFVAAQIALGPRPAGSPASGATADLIVQELTRLGWQVEEQPFDAGGVTLRNVVAKTGSGDVLVVGTHYDTSPAADQDADPANVTQPPLGADDGASGVAVLLELARSLNQEALDSQVWLAFLDGQYQQAADGSIDTVSAGAMALADSLTARPQAVILIDRVGDADQKLYYDSNSDPALSNRLWSVADQLGYVRWFVPEVRYTVDNGVLAFQALGAPAANIVNAEYPYYRTLQDTADKISRDSLERVGRVLEVYLEDGAAP
jgi:hypothetical protein